MPREIDMLDIEHDRIGTVSVVRVRGTLDALNAPSLKKEVEPLVTGEEPRLVFDLGGIELIDSSGVGALVALFKRARGMRGDISIAGLQGQPKHIFELLRLNRAFDVHDSPERAIEMMGR
ncbi:MAG: STAS domain-containing protein [Myxococcales bacterium]|nr:STAS domain-containing protein [Myxococcales bacterium]